MDLTRSIHYFHVQLLSDDKLYKTLLYVLGVIVDARTRRMRNVYDVDRAFPSIGAQ